MPDIPNILLYAVIVLLLIVATVLTIRLKGTFDFNIGSQQRYERRKEQIMALCTHTNLQPLGNNQMRWKSRMSKLPLSLTWACQGCGMMTEDQGYAETVGIHWAQMPKEWAKREKRRQKIAHKLGWS